MEPNQRERIRDLRKILHEKREVIGWDKIVSIPASGDGHSHNDSFDDVIKRVVLLEVYTHPLRERLKVRRDLRDLYGSQDVNERWGAGSALGYSIDRIKAHERFLKNPVRETAKFAGRLAACAVYVTGVMALGYYLVSSVLEKIISK